MHSEKVLEIEDFIILGDTKKAGFDDNRSKNLINEASNNDFLMTFSEGDDLMTYRGISTNSTIGDVFERYGEEEILPFNYKNDEILRILRELFVDSSLPEGNADFMRDFKNFNGDEKWVEYSYPVLETKMIYLIRFYFNTSGKIVLISYFAIDCNFGLIEQKRKTKKSHKLKIKKYSKGFFTQNEIFQYDLIFKQFMEGRK